MSAIKNIKLYNFKAFYDETTIELNDKHLLIYGENGSGKSSIYWALYTLLQSSTKETSDIEKYFDPQNDENLINTSLIDKLTIQDPLTGDVTLPTTISNNATVEVELMDGKKFELSPKGINTTELNFLKDLNRRSDFISHRLLINFYNFRNSKKINLWEVFVRDIFPFLNNNRSAGRITLTDALKDIEHTQPFIITGDYFKLTKSTKTQEDFDKKIDFFNKDIDFWLGRINTLVNDFYSEYFEPIHNERIRISLNYTTKFKFDKVHPQFYKNKERWYNYVGFNNPVIELKIEKLNEFGFYKEVARPQSYFNEAKLTSIALSVRFCLLDDTIRPTFEGQILVLDDLLVSLDMSNRDKVLDILLDKYASKYKIYLFTHEKNFFDFCSFKIEQRKKKHSWEIMEIYSGDSNIDKPVIISSITSPYEKAKKYFNAKDYTTCSLYLRKELEKLVIERLPLEHTKTIDGQYHNLEHYWKLFIERYKNLDKEISEEVKEYFRQSKLLILNPSAHYNLNLPVYKLELERVFKLVESIYNDYPIPILNIILCKGMRLKFTHPVQNYSFEFELINDFASNSIDTGNEVTNPKCKILEWQFNGKYYWVFDKANSISYDALNKPILHDILKIIKTHLGMRYLNIDLEMFLDNTVVLSDVTLKKILEEYNIKINYNMLTNNHELLLN